MKPDLKDVQDVVKEYLPSASHDRVEWGVTRVLRALRAQSGGAADASMLAHSDTEQLPVGRRMLWIPAVAAVLLAVLVGARWRQQTAGIAESVDGALLRSVGGETRSVPLGGSFGWGETVRTDDGATFAVGDGSRVEMKAKSELWLERASDGTRIRLLKGGILVEAAKRPSGHLYVQTADVAVSVVGTVFLVNADEQGSRVAVLEGEVRVQQGGTETKVLPGEQVLSKHVLQWQPVSEEIGWSRSKEMHLALLQRSTRSRIQPETVENREAFEVASVRPSSPSSGGSPGARGARGGGPTFQVEHNRFVATGATLHRLILLAYGFQGFGADPVYGGPAWMKSDGFDVQALMPEGSPSYSREQLFSGRVPKLQAMLKTLLADRFKLASHPEMKEMSVYNLVVVKEGKLKLSDDQTPRDPLAQPQGFRFGAPVPRGTIALVFTPSGGRALSGAAIPMATLAAMLSDQLGRVVVDRTHLQGLFDFRMEFASEAGLSLPAPLPADPASPYLFTALQEQLGLKLESSKAAVEVLVIDRADKLSEN